MEVERLIAVVDCSNGVNPENVRQQMEGAHNNGIDSSG